MWNNVSTFFAALFETILPPQRQRRLTFGVLVAIVSLGILLLALIVWADVFYS